MFPSSPVAAADDLAVPPGLEAVGCYATEREATEHGLVVLAMGLGYWTVDAPGGHRLLVDSAEAGAVFEQLATYDRENLNWPPKPRAVSPLRFRWFVPFLWAAAIAFVFWIQLQQPGALEAVGALHSGALFDRGEWWRPLTALFLHGDLGHLVANMAAGFFLFGLVLALRGSLAGSLLLFAASCLGNVGAAVLHPRIGYESIGASTAVFAALGLLTGGALRTALGPGRPFRLRTLLLPAFAGGSLLALHGAGGMQTDVVAHGTGFTAGLLLGLAVPEPSITRPVA